MAKSLISTEESDSYVFKNVFKGEFGREHIVDRLKYGMEQFPWLEAEIDAVITDLGNPKKWETLRKKLNEQDLNANFARLADGVAEKVKEAVEIVINRTKKRVVGAAKKTTKKTEEVENPEE